MNKRKNNNSPLKIAVLGHKTIPSRQGGIEIVVEHVLDMDTEEVAD